MIMQLQVVITPNFSCCCLFIRWKRYLGSGSFTTHRT
ncbi:hypothetical protein SETIT_7G079500v2 [Setaria italica]|uniref:Uncharacterized protein n=2 Tax=Setaria TaxID=4554 RepID=A0A368RTG0_SETIT|nr:hypothetical protein SETIT_7G079500v2 [Setaria italica]TKW04082.1 hypothetical protein SEVIR_7G086600v2 [Setaria viridis]